MNNYILAEKKNRHYRVTIISIFLFIFFIFGSLIGLGTVYKTDYLSLDFLSYDTDFNILYHLWRHARFFFPILISSVFSFGLFLIPLTFFIRGYLLCCTVSAYLVSTNCDAASLEFLCSMISVLVQLTGLFYIGTDCFLCAGRHLLHKHRKFVDSKRNHFIKTLIKVGWIVCFSIFVDACMIPSKIHSIIF